MFLFIFQKLKESLRALFGLFLGPASRTHVLPELEVLPDVARLSEYVVRVLGQNPGKYTLQGTNNYIVGKGDELYLIDTGAGVPTFVALLLQQLESTGLSKLRAVLLTHRHADHVGGLPQLLLLRPDLPVYKWLAAGEDPHIPGCSSCYQPISPGQRFELPCGTSLTAHHYPGHCSDHTCFWLEAQDAPGAMFCGDNVLGEGSCVFEQLGQYMHSLKGMSQELKQHARETGVEEVTLYPGHGPVIPDGILRIDQYIQHRQQREEQILAALAACPPDGVQGLSVRQVVQRVYGSLPMSLWLGALNSCWQHLCKLEAEGEVQCLQGASDSRPALQGCGLWQQWRLVSGLHWRLTATSQGCGRLAGQ